MATLINSNQVRLNDGTIKSTKQGEWYDGQHFFNGQLGAAGVVMDPGAVGYNQRVSDEVVAQTNPNNVSYLNSQVAADQLQAPAPIPYSSSSSSLFGPGVTSQVDTARRSLEETLGTRKQEVDTRLAELRKKEQETLTKIGDLSKPFREELENAERERLFINQNFEANQQLINELDTLLTEGNALIEQQKGVTGLAAVRNPRIQKTMDDVSARVGVIQAVINARNGQIAVAENMIDRSIDAITADRQDQISYYETILGLNNRDIISLDKQSVDLANEQLDLKKGDLERAQKTADYIKELLINPETAQMMGDAGVKLTDSVEQINAKLQTASYAKEVRDQANEISLKGGTPVLSPEGIPADQLLSFTDSRGVVHYYKMPKASSNSAFVDNFLSKALGGGDSSTLTDLTQPISTDIFSKITNIVSDVVAPRISPSAGIGSIYVDSLGRKWAYQSSGWQLMG